MKNLIAKYNYNLSGIYKIENTRNSKVYIGSAYNLYDRFRTHKSKLENNKHENNHLQMSYNKYGSDNFIFDVIEICGIEDIYTIEKSYINKVYGEMCYNMNINTHPSLALLKWNNDRKKVFTLVSPDNEMIEFIGYTDASIKIDCSPSFISNVVNGKCKSCKGWRLPINLDYNPKSNRYKKGMGAELHNVLLLGPDNKVYGPIFNWEKFAKDNDVNSSIFPNIVSGRTRYCNGWSLYTGKLTHPIEKNAKEYNIRISSPNGEIFGPISNLAKFCRSQNLPISCIRNLINGKIKKMSYKGWKLH